MFFAFQEAIIASIAGLILALYYARNVLSIPVENEDVRDLSSAIREGSMAFLKRQYTWVSIFVVILAVLISVLTDWGMPWGSLAFLTGAIFSGLAGFIGMRIAVFSNARTTLSARNSWYDGFITAFRGGSVMGFSLCSIAVMVLYSCIALYHLKWDINVINN